MHELQRSIVITLVPSQLLISLKYKSNKKLKEVIEKTGNSRECFANNKNE